MPLNSFCFLVKTSFIALPSARLPRKWVSFASLYKSFG
ncbi:Uncharacterised protein [Mycobacteroides abscessus subsp. abscessus]|nr:Uncharacterised protein [Mycobacteroides abscessus subsp. abscessus]